MRKIIAAALFVSILAVASCAGFDPNRGQQAFFRGRQIYRGMSVQALEQNFGPPDAVSSPPFYKNAASLPYSISWGPNSVEWVYVGHPRSAVLYLDNGVVSIVELIPTDRIRQ